MNLPDVQYLTVGPDADELGAFRQAKQLLELQKWTEAREAFLALATRSPSNFRYRALLAYARGQESLAAGDELRAREEWRRALILDPQLEDAKRALAVRVKQRSWVDRLLGRA
jgi:tetratricopeptide (TPR) repeat protein